MRPIKFRGRYVKDYVGNEYIAEGEMIFGGFAMIDGKPHIIPHDIALEVEPDSVAQLVGYDKNGKEVYEGDIIVDEYVEGKSCEHVARLEPMTQVPETAEFYFFPYPAPFTTLKEDNQ